MELKKRTQAFAMRCYVMLLNISCKDHITNKEVGRKSQAAIGDQWLIQRGSAVLKRAPFLS
ncbi:MAG: hypothetical protein AB2693_17275, partial [Candidatus Thiodiazotropha sp.]